MSLSLNRTAERFEFGLALIQAFPFHSGATLFVRLLYIDPVLFPGLYPPLLNIILSVFFKVSCQIIQGRPRDSVQWDTNTCWPGQMFGQQGCLDHINNMERDQEGNRNGNVYVVAITHQQMQELVSIMNHFRQIWVQQMQNNDAAFLHQRILVQQMQINNQLLLGNIVPIGNVQIPQLEPDRANPGDGISNLLGLYAGSQGAIFNAAFFVEGRRGCEIVWSRLILSALVSIATIFSVSQIFFQQFTRLPQENYRSWVAQKAAIIVMLMAFSVCLLLSCTSVLCNSGR